MQDSEIHEPKLNSDAYSLQLGLPLPVLSPVRRLDMESVDALRTLLAGDLDFHDDDSTYATHNFHAFPAKFPPQLPRTFIEALTNPGDIILDPMAGSGTTVVEALLTGRRGLGFDIDPLALRLTKAKVSPLPMAETMTAGYKALEAAQELLDQSPALVHAELERRFGSAEHKFLDYWFLHSTQLELMALVHQIQLVADSRIRKFLELTLSAIIITKSGGVSLARDLAHTRPHRVHGKTPRSPFEEYRKRLSKNLHSLRELCVGLGQGEVICGNAQALPLRDNSVDLIVTSPPYASNAIDYMRAHKFALVWLGYPLGSLSQLRAKYIGHDATGELVPIQLPEFASQIITSLRTVDAKKAKVLHRYYYEMANSLHEMARVLKPGKAAVVVVGTSTMRGIDTRTDVCLAEIGKQVGLELIGIGMRNLDRDRRMMPARSRQSGIGSQIEQRMHEEYVIGFIKPGLT